MVISDTERAEFWEQQGFNEPFDETHDEIIEKVKATKEALKKFDEGGWDLVLSGLKGNLKEIGISNWRVSGIVVAVAVDIIRIQTGLHLAYDDTRNDIALNVISSYIYRL